MVKIVNFMLRLFFYLSSCYLFSFSFLAMQWPWVQSGTKPTLCAVEAQNKTKQNTTGSPGKSLFYHNLKIKWSSRLFSGGESLAHELERQQSWDELEWGLAWSELGWDRRGGQHALVSPEVQLRNWDLRSSLSHSLESNLCLLVKINTFLGVS